MWTGHDTLLLFYAVLAIALIVVLIAYVKMHAFLALMIGSLFVGLAAGLGPDKVVDSFPRGSAARLAPLASCWLLARCSASCWPIRAALTRSLRPSWPEAANAGCRGRWP